MRRIAVSVCLLAAVGAACDSGNGNANPFTNSPTPSESVRPTATATSASPTPPATPATPPPTAGPKTSTCVNGWVTPKRKSALFTDPIGIIRRTTPFRGPYVVVDMRYFVGPESPPSDQGYIRDVKRWYVKLYAPSDLAYQGRFLVEQRVFGRGLAAVAPYDTHGFRSPDWVGFQWDTADTTPKAYAGLPGRWRGIPYDFVRGGQGLTIPGLPDAVRGCLEGT